MRNLLTITTLLLSPTTDRCAFGFCALGNYEYLRVEQGK